MECRTEGCGNEANATIGGDLCRECCNRLYEETQLAADAAWAAGRRSARERFYEEERKNRAWLHKQVAKEIPGYPDPDHYWDKEERESLEEERLNKLDGRLY